MRVVDVTSLYSQNGGGIRTYLREKSRRLVALGHEVHRIVPGATTSSRGCADGAIEHTLAGPPLPFDRNYRWFPKLSELGALLHGLGPDVVEVGSHYVLPWRIRTLAPPGTRIVGFFHSNVPDTFVAPATARLPGALADAVIETSWRVVRAMHAHYDATLCASAMVETRLRDHQVPRVVRVGLGVDCHHFAERQRFEPNGTVCYIGRLSRDKEAELLLAAAPALAAAGLTLQVAGDGPMASRFRRSRHLRYLGVLPAPEISALLRRSDVCLVPGRYETFSFATAEALACGTPVVCAEGGAAAELVLRGRCGSGFRNGCAAAMVAAVQRWHTAPIDLRRAAAATGRAFVERELSWDVVVARVLATYHGDPRVAPLRSGLAGRPLRAEA